MIRFSLTGLLAALGLSLLLTGCTSADADPSPSAVSQASSAARMAVVDSVLFTIDGQTVRLFQLNTASTSAPTPRPLGQVRLDVAIETIYPAGNYLFVGTQAGMYLYDVTTPQLPRRISHLQQAVSCDPVAVEGRWAYFTTRAGRSCGSSLNQLLVVDLLNPSQPARNYPLILPFGLGLDSTNVYVCDTGLKVFDRGQVPTLTQRDYFSIDAYEVLPSHGHLLIIGSTGLYQYKYDYSTRSLRFLSVLPITPRR
jgi:hypothetical protein